MTPAEPPGGGVPESHNAREQPPGEHPQPGTDAPSTGAEDFEARAEVADDPERLVSLWERWAANPGLGYPPSRWGVNRSYPLRYWQAVNPALSLDRSLAGPTTGRGGHREYRLFERGVDPNTLHLDEGAADGH
jgi:hypothetical protein